jgi:hypothetical protein
MLDEIISGAMMSGYVLMGTSYVEHKHPDMSKGEQRNIVDEMLRIGGIRDEYIRVSLDAYYKTKEDGD